MSEALLAKKAAPPGTGLHRVGAWLWYALILMVVLLAVYVSVGRYAMSNIGSLREPLLDALNERLPFAVDARRITGAWSAFSPEVAFDGLLITQPRDDVQPVRISRGRLRLDIPASLASRSLQLSQLELEGLSLEARLTAEGSFEIVGFEDGGGGALLPWLNEFLPRVERVSLLDNALTLIGVGARRSLRADLTLTRAGNARLLQGQLAGDGLRLAVHADGVGNPLRPLSWSGDVFLDIASAELGDLSALWKSLDWPFSLSGSAQAQFWLNRSAGDSQARLRMNGADVQVTERGGAWSLPLDVLAFEAGLTQRRNHWALIAEGFHAEREGQVLDLPRAQFEWWGSALRLRARELALDSLPTLLAAAPGIPQGLRDALPILAPRGRLERVELRLDDLGAPAESWSLRGLLNELSVESWRGAPALTGVSGYLELEPGEGQVQLDAGPFVLGFPRIYDEPLRYEAAWGDIGLSWDREALRIDSGLIHTRGPEGDVRALFAVDVPFTPSVTGVQMDLLAGLANSDARYRNKYIPRVLPAGLLGWLDGSIEAGTLNSAGFIWRGSLKKEEAVHRTVQLFVDVEDARLRFDPAWPALTDLDATVLVSDGLTRGTASRARILDAQLDELSVRVLPVPGEVLLSVRSQLRGDAADGHQLLVDSPLAAYSRNTFAGWTMAGDIAGSFALDLPIRRGGAKAEIDLALELSGVSSRMTALALPVEDIRGSLLYSSESGFAGSALQGQLWSQGITATAPPGAAQGIEIALAGVIDVGQLSPWLQQPVLGFAQGTAPFEGELRVGGDFSPALRLRSELQGVSLEAPRPFGKTSDAVLPLAVDLALSSDPRLMLSLGERLDLALSFAEGAMQRLQASIGGTGQTMDCDARFCATGEVSELDLAAWRGFGERYLFAEREPADPAPVTAVADAPPPSYRIDSLGVGRLSAGERQLGAARLDLWGVGALWQGSIEADWVQGALTREAGSDGLELLIEHLDLAGLQGGGDLELEAVRALLPTMRVDVLELRDGERLLGALGFTIDAQQPDNALYFSDIEGELWNVDLAEAAPGMLVWGGGATGEETTLELDLGIANIGDTLEAMGYARTVESDGGRGTLRLRWPGAPTQLAFAAAQGSFDLVLKDGRFLETRPGALAMVSFLNFAEILRRLSLSHMFESGIPFDRARADLEFAAGVMTITDLEIDGAASAFAFNGTRALDTGEIDGELVVTLPVANNLPWVAALAGGPAVAAGVFVVSKVFEKQVNRMSSAVYQVSGGIDDPQVSFRRLFDDRPAQPVQEPQETVENLADDPPPPSQEQEQERSAAPVADAGNKGEPSPPEAP